MKTTLALRRPPRGYASPAAALGPSADPSADLVNAAAASTSDLYSAKWLFAFVGVEIACQLALLSEAIAPVRLFVRIAAFIGSIAYVFLLQAKSVRSHPSGRLAIVALAILTASILHPETSSVWGGIASVSLHLAVFAPIFWVPRIRLHPSTVRRLFLVLWAFQTASAVAGALQIYYPGRFQPALSKALGAAEGLYIVLADGTSVFRPMGLTDTPGGAAMAGTYCVLLGCGFLITAGSWRARLPFVASIAVGLFALYLCQVRSLLVMTGISVLAMGLPFARQGKLRMFMKLVATVFTVAVGAFFVAVTVGGQGVLDRVSTLIAADPATVYYNNRGFFLEHTLLELVPQYPIGAGLARWGMIAAYFGETFSHSLWAEVQWTAWLYDGGIPLILVYGAAIATALLTALRIATHKGASSDDEFKLWSTVLFGYGIGVLATTFNGCPFEGTAGVDFWILNAAVFAANAQLRMTPSE
jgi:hypothetical protein